MVTRREVVTTGALGALGAASTDGRAEGHAARAGSAEMQSPEAISAQALRELAREVGEIRQQMRDAFLGPSLSQGLVVDVRRQFAQFMKANQKYPDYVEVGPGVFTDVYDWHVRHRQPLEVTRVDNRMAIRFMFTWLILRPDQVDGFVGIPFDRG